jgi:hypothetical protein
VRRSGSWLHPPVRRLRVLALAALIVLAASGARSQVPPEGGAPREQSAASDLAISRAPSVPADDGWPDLSDFLDKSYGFVPIVVPVTEPAVGYGAGGGLAFVDKNRDADRNRYARPNITFVGGLGTENGSWGSAIGDLRNWYGDRLQTLAGVLYASVNLDFYGTGEYGGSGASPLGYTLEPAAAFLQSKYRLGTTRIWAGLAYAFSATQVAFDAPEGTPGLPDYRERSDVGCLSPSFNYDSRDNIFTPITGTYLETAVGIFSHVFGGDDEFQRVRLIALQYLPVRPGWYLGLRGDATGSYGDVPFYLLPYISLRGAPIMRYQGRQVAQAEAELRWQFWGRISAVGFGGYGAAWRDAGGSNSTKAIQTGGVGVRYELARRYGIHGGVDLAFGPDVVAVYFQTGSAWARP